jgi:hypothetical protein
MRPSVKTALVFLFAFWLWGWFDPFRFAKPAIIAQEPIETETKLAPFLFKSYGLFPRIFLIEPRMTYDITGRVLHKKLYVTRGFFSDIIPYDFALGWKGMSDLNIIRPYMSFDHHGAHAIGRYYKFKYHWDGDTPPEYIAAMGDTSIKSNNHLIPANSEIFLKLWWAGTGDIVRLKGYLVDVEWPENPGWIWKTALTPAGNHFEKWGDDNPDCQTMFVTDATLM